MTDRGNLRTFGAIDAFFGGIGFVIARPRVWGWAIIPAVFLMALFVGFLALTVWGAADLDRAIFGIHRGTWGAVGYWALMALLVVIAILIALLLALAFTEPLSAFALERISQAQTRALDCMEPKAPSLFASMWLSLCAVLFALVFGGLALVALLLISLFYPPAAVVTVPLKALVCGWMLAWDLFDYPLGLRGMGIWKRIKWIYRNFGAFTLFGLMWGTVAVVPGVVLVLLPDGGSGRNADGAEGRPRVAE